MEQMRNGLKILSDLVVVGDHCEDQGVDERTILMYTTSSVGCVNWFYLSQDRCQKQTVLKTVMNFGIA
jgi:hypothetical protein